MTQRQELIVVAYTHSMNENIQRAFKITSFREPIKVLLQHSECKMNVEVKFINYLQRNHYKNVLLGKI